MNNNEIITNLENIKNNADNVSSNIAELYYNFLQTNIPATDKNIEDIIKFILNTKKTMSFRS